METMKNGFQDMSSQMSSLVLNTEKLQHQYAMSSRHTQGFLAANDEDGLSRMVRAYIRQAMQDSKTVSDDEMMSHVDTISMGISADAQQYALFSASNQPTNDVLQDASEISPSEGVHSVARILESAKNRKPRFIRLFRTQRHFYSKVAKIKVRLNQLRKRCILVPDTLLYFSIEVDIIPRMLTRWGLSISFSNIPNDGGYFSLCPSIRPVLVRAKEDPIWEILDSDDVNAFTLEYKTGRVSPSDCHELDDYNVFEVS